MVELDDEGYETHTFCMSWFSLVGNSQDMPFLLPANTSAMTLRKSEVCSEQPCCTNLCLSYKEQGSCL